MKAIRFHEFGGPDVMHLEDVPDPTPGEGQLLVRIRATGINFIETYQRTGAYKIDLPGPPAPRARATSSPSARASPASGPATASSSTAPPAPTPR